MLIRFPPQPEAVARAALLHHRDGVAVAPRGEDLLVAWDADVEDREQVERCQTLLRQERWAAEFAGKRLHNLLFYSLRHQHPPWQLMLQTVAELLDKGPRYVFAPAGDAARALDARANQVRKEIHRLRGVVRLTPAPDGVLVARAQIVHNCGDILALALAGRNPGQPLALLTPKGNWFVSADSVAPFDGLRYRQVEDEDFSRLWLTYYRSQFIRERNNPRHAARAIPKRYWQWLTEGEELAKNEAPATD